MYQFTFSEQKTPDNSQVHRSLQKCHSSLREFLHFTLLVPGFWR